MASSGCFDASGKPISKIFINSAKRIAGTNSDYIFETPNEPNIHTGPPCFVAVSDVTLPHDWSQITSNSDKIYIQERINTTLPVQFSDVIVELLVGSYTITTLAQHIRISLTQHCAGTYTAVPVQNGSRIGITLTAGSTGQRFSIFDDVSLRSVNFQGKVWPNPRSVNTIINTPAMMSVPGNDVRGFTLYVETGPVSLCG